MAIRTIHVGTGGRGLWPVQMFPEHEAFEPVALVDVSPENLAKGRESTGLGEDRCFGAMADAIAAVEADAVIIITPPRLHAAQCLEAVRAGKHVMVEKPFTLSLAQAKEVVEEADRQGVRVVVTQNNHLSDTFVTLARLVQGGDYGKAQMGSLMKFCMRTRTHHSGDMRHSYLWERGVHDFDTILAVMGGAPVRVWGRSFNATFSPYAHGASVQACLEFADGATFAYLSSFATHRRGDSLFIDCERACLEVVGARIRVTRPDVDEPEVIDPDPAPEGTRVIADAFAAYITDGVEPRFSGRGNLTTVGLVEAVGAASDRNEVIDLAGHLGA